VKALIPLLLVLGAVPALAAEGTPLPLAPEERRQAYETWQTPNPRTQLEADPTLLPVGRGGILVPSMTEPRLEPRVRVTDLEGQAVADAMSGATIVVHPGEYLVHVGSGGLDDQLTVRVKVHEGRTEVVEPVWAGLRVEVVNAHAVPFRGTYELVALPSRSSLGVGFGARVEMGERVDTWLLPPGTYMLLKPGENYQARANFFTLRLGQARLESFTLVLNEDTGDFLGAGEVQLSEEASRVRGFLVSMILGGSLLLNNRSNVPGTTPGNSFTVELFFDSIARWLYGKHYLYNRLRVEEGQTKQPNTSFQVSIDEVALDSIYIWKVVPWLGPYLRGGLRTTAFPGVRYFDTPTTVEVGHFVPDPVSGAPTWTPLAPRQDDLSEFHLSDRFFPLTLSAGTGLNLDASISYLLDVSTRMGVGVRKSFYNGLLLNSDLGSTPDVVEFERIEDSFVKGFEGALILNARLTRWVILSTEFDVIAPFDDLDDPVVDLYTNAGLRLSSFASLNYIVKLLYDRNVSPDPQVEQRLMLRFSYKFL
jgi:hypothetical protein